MANLGALLKGEIGRLARREVRAEVDTTRKAVAQYRHDIAGLKREMADLRRQIALLGRQRQADAVSPDPARKLRFVAKGLQAHRERLGLSAADFGRLVNVSPQTVRNWETQATHPSRDDLLAIDRVRRLGKRQAQALLARQPAPKKAAKNGA